MYYQLYHARYMSTFIFKSLEFRVILKEEKVKEQRGGQKHLKKKQVVAYLVMWEHLGQNWNLHWSQVSMERILCR